MAAAVDHHQFATHPALRPSMSATRSPPGETRGSRRSRSPADSSNVLPIGYSSLNRSLGGLGEPCIGT